jgi:hypothetical protein
MPQNWWHSAEQIALSGIKLFPPKSQFRDTTGSLKQVYVFITLIHKPSPSLYLSLGNTIQMYHSHTHHTPLLTVASDVCWGVQKMFRTCAKYTDTECTVKFNKPMHFTPHKQTNTHTHTEQNPDIPPLLHGSLWANRNFLLHISTHHHPWCMATLRWKNTGAASGFDRTHAHARTHTHTHTQRTSSTRSNPLFLLHFISCNCLSVCYKFVEWNKRIPLQRISNQKQ